MSANQVKTAKGPANTGVRAGLTDVYDASTGEVVASYSLPPVVALVAAWEQHHRNFNTWEYAKAIEAETYPLKRGKYGWCLGRFWVKEEV